VSTLISIIIPTFNRVSLIGETLDSIIAQTFTNWECLVVDDGSVDRTEELLKFYTELDPRIQFHKRPANRKKGANSCRNYGFEISQGTYINWFDSDDLMHPEKLGLQFNQLSGSNFNLCVCQSLVFENDIKKTLGRRFENLLSENILYDYLRMKIGWLTQEPLWSRKFVLKLPKIFNEDLLAAQEWEFHARALSLMDTYAVIDKPLVYHRKHKNTITYSKNILFKEWNYFLARLEVYRNIDLERRSNLFLKNYLINYFKKTIVVRDFKRAIHCWYMFYIKESEVSYSKKGIALIAIFSYRLFNNGNYFLQKINY